jgi:HTH-type transcriptional regulator / antitoxin HipB
MTEPILGREQSEHTMDDLDAYIATLTEAEREDLAVAEAAIDIAALLYEARERRGLSQTAAAERAGLQQQAVSRLERPHANVRLATLQKYLGALGYAVEINVIDLETGSSAARAVLTSKPPTHVRTA